MKSNSEDRIQFALYVISGALLASLVVLSLLCSGCSSTNLKAIESANGKNIGVSGYVMVGELGNDANGRIVIGRVDYKSRKVSIPADTKTPNSGFFRATKNQSLFGTTEQIIEYDWTAGSDADAEKAEKICEELKRKAEEEFKAKEAE